MIGLRRHVTHSNTFDDALEAMGLILLISPRNQGSSAIFTISCFFSVKLEYGVHIFKKSLALKVIIHNMNYVHGVQ